MNTDDKDISEKAWKFIKKNKQDLVNKFAGKAPSHKKSELTVAIFMAGAPGAGKTEFSKALLSSFPKEFTKKIVRIDADEIRGFLPHDLYNGKNAHMVQRAASKGVDKLFDHAIEKNKHFILDGTFSNYEQARKNIERALKKNRKIEIWYIYQDPIIAWEFTKKREALEGRRIRREDFIEAFFKSQKNVNQIKKEFGGKVKINLAIKHHSQIGLEKFKLNIQNIDGYINNEYNETSLEDLIQ